MLLGQTKGGAKVYNDQPVDVHNNLVSGGREKSQIAMQRYTSRNLLFGISLLAPYGEQRQPFRNCSLFRSAYN